MVNPIDHPVSGNLEAGEIGEGGHEIQRRKNGIGLGTSLHPARPTDDAGNAIASLITGTLPVPQRPSLAPEDRPLRVAFLFVGVGGLIPRAVVGCVDHQRVVAQALLVQDVKQTASLIIELLHHITVQTSI